MPFGFPIFGAGGYPGAVARVDSIMTVGQTLLSYSNSNLQNGDLVYVGNETFVGQGSIKAYVRVRIGAGLTPVEGMVWNSTAMTTPQVQYERICEASAKHLQQFVWFLTNDNSLGPEIIDNDGNDTNFRVSMREVNRRRAADSQGIGTIITIVVPEDMGSPARQELLPVALDNWWCVDGNGGVVLIGQPETLFSGAVVTFTPAVPGSNTGYILNVVGIGAVATRGSLLRQNAGDANNVIHAIVADVIDDDNVRCSQPRNGSASTFNSGSPAVFSTTVEVLRCRDMPIWPFMAEKIDFPAAQYLNFAGFDAEFNDFRLDDCGAFIIANTIVGVNIIGGGNQARFSACGFRGFNNIVAPMMLNIIGCQFGGSGSTDPETEVLGRLNVQGGPLVVTDANDSTHCDINLFDSATWLMAGGSSRAMSVFDNDSTVGAFHVNFGLSCYYQSDGVIYGSGNSGRLFFVLAGGYVRVPKDFVTFVSEAEHVLLVEDGTGGNYDIAHISIPNPNGGGIFDPNFTHYYGPILFTGAILTAGSTTTSHLANGGAAPAVAVGVLQNQPAQLYPSPGNLFRKLTVTKLSDTAGVDVTVTLLVNGAASDMTVTILHADPVGTIYTDETHPTAATSGDTLDLNMAAVGDSAPGIVSCSAILT